MLNNVFALAGVVIKELYRRKDFYVLFILTALLTVLLASLSFFNEARVVRYMKELCLLLIWVCSLVIAITTAARQIPAERENRTIFPLLAKPVTRMEVVVGKFLGCWLATGLALGVFYLFFGLISGAREHVWPLASYIQAFWLHWVMLAVVIAATLLGSVVLTTPSANVTICFIITVGILLLGRHLHKVAMRLPEPRQSILAGLYFVIPHLEFYDVRDLVVHNWNPVAWWAVGVATLYGAAYACLFLLAAGFVFRKKPLN